MSDISIPPGEPIRLSVILWDRDTTKFVQARIFNDAGVELAGSPMAVAHVASGLYDEPNGPTMPTTPVRVIANAYDDAGFTVLSSTHFQSGYYVNPTKESAIVDLINEVIARLDGTLGSINPVSVEVAKQDILCSIEQLQTAIEIVTGQARVTIDQDESAAQIDQVNTTVEVKDC